MDVDVLVAAGLYTPTDPDAQDRLGLLEYLLDEGATIDEMVEANRYGNLSSLGFDLHMRRGELSVLDLAERSGMDLAIVLEAYRLLGIPVESTTERVYSESEARLFELLPVGEQALPVGMVAEILRSIGSALAVVAESEVSAFIGSVESLLEQVSQRRRAEITTATGDLALELGEMMKPLLRHHLWAAVRRQRSAIAGAADRRRSTVSVGFVDLVGFTALTATMESAELLEFMRAFQSRTFDIVTAAGGRVVKHIGDEIMFSSGEAAAACGIALDLVAAFGDDGSQPRGGLSHGVVVARHGDFYGPVVNLAARLTDVAVPGEVLADSALRLSVEDDAGLAFDPAGRRQLKGFAEPVLVVSIRRSA